MLGEELGQLGMKEDFGVYDGVLAEWPRKCHRSKYYKGASRLKSNVQVPRLTELQRAGETKYRTWEGVLRCLTLL